MKRSLTPDEIEYYQSQGYNMQNYKGEALDFPDESSVKGSVGRSALVSALPTAAGGAAFAGTMLALAPETLGASLLAIPAAAAMGYGGSKLASKIQEPLMTEDFKKQLAVDAQIHPYATAGGALATMPLGGFNPSPANVAKAGGALGRLALGLGTNPAERQALVNVGSGAALGGIQEAVLAPIEGRDITAKDVALAAATGGVFSKPNVLGRNIYKFHDGTGRVVETPTALTKQLAPANVQQRAPIASVQPNLTMEEYINKAIGVPTLNKDNTPRIAKSAETSGKNISDLLEKGAEVVSRESIQGDVDKRVKAILEKEAKAQKPVTAKAEPVVPATELKTEVAGALKAKNLSAALTPEYADTIITEILNERGIQVAPDGSLPINGKAFFDEGTRKVLFNPDKASVDTLPHEGLHHMRWDLEAAAEKGDARAKSLLEAWDKLSAPELEKINAERVAAKLEPQDAHEFAVSQQGFEFVKQQLNLKRETPWKRWWNDTKALFNAKYNTGKVSLEDMRRAVNFKFVHERQKLQTQVGNKQEREQGQESLTYSPDDLSEYDRLKAEQLRLISEGKVMDKEGKMTSEFHQVWTDFEKVRNRNNGMPPKQYEGRSQPENEGLSSNEFTPKPARVRIRNEEEKAKMRADRAGYAEQQKSEYDKIVKPEERRSAGVKPYTYPQDKEWTALFDTRENTPPRRIPLSDVVNLDTRAGMADFNEYVRRAVYTAANRIRAEKKGAELPPSYDPSTKTYGIGRQDYEEIAATVAADVKANGVDRDNYQGAGAMTLKRTLYRRARDAWKEAIRIKSQEKGQRSLDMDVGEEGKTSVMDVTPDTTETQTRATVVPEVKKGMTPQEAAAAKVKALEEERATAVEEYGENSDAVGEIDNEIEMWSKRAGRAQGEGEGLSEKEQRDKNLNPEWRQDQKEEQDSLYRPIPTSASKRKFDEMRAAASREQPLDEGLRQDLLKDTVLHTVRDENSIPEIIKSGLLRGSNVSMDGLKENQSLGHGVTLVYDKQHVSAESKGYNPNDGIVTRQQPAKPKAILVEVGDIIEDAPITMDELLAKIDSITERRNTKDKIADELYKKSLANYNKQLADLQVSKTPDGYIISTPSKTEKVKGVYDPSKGYSEETERTIPSISKPFSEIKIGDSNYLKMSNHHVSLRAGESVQDAARRFFAEKFLELKEPEQNTKRNRMEEYELDKLYSKFDSMTQKGIDKHPGYTQQDYIDSLNLPKDIPTYTYEANEDGGMDNIRRISSGRNQEEGEGLFSGKHSFFSAMAPTFDKVKTINPELGDAFDKWEIAKRGYTGMRNEALASLQKFNPEDVKRVAELRREAFRKDDAEPLNLTGEDADINEALKKYYFDDIGMARQNLGLLIDNRAAGTNQNYQPDMLNEQTIDLFVSRPNSPEALYAVNKWAEYVAEHSEGEVSFSEAKKHINDYIDAIGGKNDNYKAVNFGAIRKAQGYGLPDELRELDPLKTLSRYGSRAASDLAMFQELESQPAIAAALKIPNPNTGKIPDHPNSEMRYSAQKEVRNAMKWVMNDFGNTLSKSQPHVNAFVRLVHNSLLGGATGLRDLASVPVNMMPYIHSFSDLSAALKGMVNFREHAADALRSGAKQPNLDLVQFNTILDSPSRGLALMHKAATAMRKWQGREALENFSRDITFAAGKELALAHIEGAKNGNRNSENFIEKFGKGAEGKTDEEAANIMAANFTERNQGTYGGRGLPVGIVESQFAPFFSLQKWGVEKANVIFQDVFKPALTGESYVPLLTYSLGTILTGAAIQEMNKVLMGRKPQDPDVKEALAKGDAKAYAQELATLMQLGNFSGIVGDVMKAAVDAGVRGKTSRNVVSFPTYTAVSDTGEKLTDMAEAIRQGENPWEVIKMFSIDMLSQNIQNVRALANRTVKEKDLERSDKFRDRRIYNELEGKPAGEIPKPNKYLGIEERKFKQASTPAEIRELLPQVLAKAKRQAEGNPEKLRQAIVSLKGNSYQTMPSPTDSPYEFRAYYDYLVKTQGKTEADKRVKDYLMQRMLNQQKSKLLPTVRHQSHIKSLFSSSRASIFLAM